MLKNSGLTDAQFSTLVETLKQAPHLQVLDISENELTESCCSDVCTMITNASKLATFTISGNAIPIKMIGYFMTAIMERNSKGLAKMDVFNMTKTKEITESVNEDDQEVLTLAKRIEEKTRKNCSLKIAGTLLQAGRELWDFLYSTNHPQVKTLSTTEMQWQYLEQVAYDKLKSCLSRILLVEDDGAGSLKRFHADLCMLGGAAKPATSVLVDTQETEEEIEAAIAEKVADLRGGFSPKSGQEVATTKQQQMVLHQQPQQQIMLHKRLLETTSINARDVESGQTLLEYSCHINNLGLAKVCYRRGANLSARTLNGDTPFNIATRNKGYKLMEFLHTYGVKVNSTDQEGRTGLHVATANNDVDGICRLIEWGADVSVRDKKRRTPLQYAAIGGHMEVAMLLLELGADLNAKDEKGYTAVAHAEANDHFKLMDRLSALGGKNHQLHQPNSQVAPVVNSPKHGGILAGDTMDEVAGSTKRSGFDIDDPSLTVAALRKSPSAGKLRKIKLSS